MRTERIGPGTVLNVSVLGSPTDVTVSNDSAADADPQVMAKVAAAVDAALATGRDDALFVAGDGTDE